MQRATGFLVVAVGVLALMLMGADGARAEEAPVAVAPTPASPLGTTEVVEGFDEIEVEELQVEDVPLEELGEVVVTATRTRRLEVDVPRAMNVVVAKRIVERGVTSVIDSLDRQMGVWIEKRTSHSSDPVVRGLSGSNILTLVDGNTLSTFWGEGGFAGDDMYGKIDPENVERLEVVRGPSSVLYGSNALGAVINVITKESPFDYTACGTKWGFRTYVQGNSDTSGWRLRQEAYGASERFRWFAGVTYIDLGSTRDGGGQVQTPTGARGWYADVALNWKVSEIVRAKFTAQWTDLDPVYRYYRPTQDNRNQRIALSGWLEFVDLERRVGFADDIRLALYYQNKTDTRRWHDAAGAQTKWGEAVWKTVQVDLLANKQLSCHALTYGVEFESTWGESPDDEQFTMHFPDGTVRKAAPDSVWSSLGFYAQDVWQVSDRWTITGSARVDALRFSTDVDANYVPPGGLDPAVDEFEDWQAAFAGGLQASYAIRPDTHAYGGWSRGFRQFAPRFGVSEHAWGIVVPNQFLDPVTADQFEVGLKHRSKYVTFDLVGYYTWFNDFQNVVPGSFQGQDWYDYNGNGIRDPGEDVYVNVGNGEAFVYGIETYAEVNLAAVDCSTFGEAWTVAAGFMYNYGQDETNDIPIRHTHPMTGLVKLRWEIPKAPPRAWLELMGQFVDRYDRIPPDRLANDVGYLEDPQDPTSGMRRPWGLPGYSVWDLRGGILVSESVEITFGLNNIFDKLYRPAHARWDAPGRNVYFGLNVIL